MSGSPTNPLGVPSRVWTSLAATVATNVVSPVAVSKTYRFGLIATAATPSVLELAANTPFEMKYTCEPSFETAVIDAV